VPVRDFNYVGEDVRLVACLVKIYILPARDENNCPAVHFGVFDAVFW